MRVVYELNDEIIHHSYNPYFLPCVGDMVVLNNASYKVKSRIFDVDNKVVALILEM